MTTINSKPDAYAVWKIKDFRLFILSRFFIAFSIQMQSVVVGWQIYEHTKDALSLGMIGLTEAIPFLVIALFAGHIADIFQRKKIMFFTTILYWISITALFIITYKFSFVFKTIGTLPIYCIVFITGLIRGLMYPATMSLMSQIVPRNLYANATTWNSTIWHIAAVSGPAVGGLIYGFAGINVAYFTIVCLILIPIIAILLIGHYPAVIKEKRETFIESTRIGFKFVFSNQQLIGAMSLDMFAVLFGGAVALLPMFASEILHVGPEGLGFLRAAPAAGSVLMSLFLAHHPPLEKAGNVLFLAVIGFGLSTIFFALSENFYISFFFLVLTGLFDNVSVIIRGTIMQLYTPDEMRGRVTAINSVFIGSSNEIGAFESGLAARIMGLIPSVIFGGAMSIGIAATIYQLAPKLKKLNLKTALQQNH